MLKIVGLQAKTEGQSFVVLFLEINRINDIMYSGGGKMAYETKVILALLAQQVGKAKSVKEAYTAIARAANVEGILLASYEDFLKELEDALSYKKQALARSPQVACFFLRR